MCGICGIISPEGRLGPSDVDIVERMKARLVHRGPDAEGLEKDKHFIFGHRRLSIIDLEHGNQPMQTEDGRISMVYNGEIYNYLELRQALTRKGARFKTFSDTEVLLRLYELEGIESVKKLNGMFAFAVYDKGKRLFEAARDPFGIKPFYYMLLPNGDMMFASEIKAFWVNSEAIPLVNEEALREYLTFQFCLNGKTLFKNINSLEPGSTISWKVGKRNPQKTKKYWELNYVIDTHHTEEYFQDRLLTLLDDTVRLQLRSDVPVGTHLSGGLDSSIVTCLASRHYGNTLSAFTGKFAEGPEFDESGYAKKVSEFCECRLQEIVPSAADFENSIKDIVIHMDQPAAGPGAFAQYMVSKLASENVKVVLGGQGGDEIFGGYARYLIGYLEQCLKGAIHETQEEGKHIVTLDSIIPNLPVLKNYVGLMQTFLQDGLFRDMDERYFRLIDRGEETRDKVAPGFFGEEDRMRIFEEFKSVFNHPDTLSYFNKMTHFDQKTLLPALLHVEDRVSMATSLESRVPLLDTRIVDMITTMPPPMKFKGGRSKHILRSAVTNAVPEEILSRKDKMGFPVPINHWFAGPLKGFVTDTLLSQRSLQRGIYTRKGLEALISNTGPYSRGLWGALNLELWFQAFIDG